MKHTTNVSLTEVQDQAKEIKRVYPQLTDYEALSLAIQYQRNLVLAMAFVLSPTDSYPGALESIAMKLGQDAIQ